MTEYMRAIKLSEEEKIITLETLWEKAFLSTGLDSERRKLVDSFSDTVSDECDELTAVSLDQIVEFAFRQFEKNKELSDCHFIYDESRSIIIE